MRKLLFPALCLGIVVVAHAASARAQDAGDGAAQFLANSTPEQRAQVRTDRMKQALGLDDAQVEKVHAINLKYAKEATDILAGPAAERPSKLAAMSKRKDEDLKGALSSEQFQKYEVEREKWRSQAAEAAGAMAAPSEEKGKAAGEGASDVP